MLTASPDQTLGEQGTEPAEGGGGWERPPGPWVPFGWRDFARKYGLLLRHEGEVGKVTAHLLSRLVLLGASQLGWLADEIVSRGWRSQTMAGPLFILGHQRSGTTFLHRLLASDRDHARALAFHEMLLPATSIQRTLGAFRALDDRTGGVLRRWLERAETRLFGPLDDLHRIRFGEIEEDEFVLWAIYASAMCAHDAPSVAEMEGLDSIRDFEGWPRKRQLQVLGWYRACLLKKVHRENETPTGNLPWVVSKNPAFTHKTTQLQRVFPGARMVLLVRNPLEAIPSRLSLIREIWRTRFKGFRQMTSRQVEVIYADSLRTYRSGETLYDGILESSRVTVRYEDLLRSPSDVVRSIYRRFGFPGPGETLATLMAETSKPGTKYSSNHRYTLEEFGLNEDRIRRDLAGVFVHHGFG